MGLRDRSSRGSPSRSLQAKFLTVFREQWKVLAVRSTLPWVSMKVFPYRIPVGEEDLPGLQGVNAVELLVGELNHDPPSSVILRRSLRLFIWREVLLTL